MSFTSPTATASVAFRPNGIYYGYVTSVNQSTRRVYVNIARLNGGTELGPLQVLSVNLPSVGALVGCVFAENRSDDLLVIGPIQQSGSLRYAPPVTCLSTTRPASGQVPAGTFIFETDTNKTFVWSGTAWVGVNNGGNFNSNNVFINSNGIGIGAASIRPPLSITSTYDPIQSTAVTNASAGAIQIGAVSTNNMVIDHNSIQSRNNGAVAGLTLNPKGGEVTIGGTLNVAGGLNAGSLTTGTVPSGRLSGSYTGITELGGLKSVSVGDLRFIQNGTEITSSYAMNSTPYELFRVQGRIASSQPFTWMAFKNGMKIGQYNNGVSGEPTTASPISAENWSGIFFTNSTDNSIGANSAATFYPGIMSAPGSNNVIIGAKPNGVVRFRSRTEIRSQVGAPASLGFVEKTGAQNIVSLTVNVDGGATDPLNSVGFYAYGRPSEPWVFEIRRNGEGFFKGPLYFMRAGALKGGSIILSQNATQIGGPLANNDATGVASDDLSYGLYASGSASWPVSVRRNGVTTLGGNGSDEIYLNTTDQGGANFVLVDSFGRMVRASSRASIKENIADIDDALGSITALQPRTFTFKPEAAGVDDPEKAQYYRMDNRFGFVVDELLEDNPRLVSYMANEEHADDISQWTPQYWRTDDMIALLTAGVQELVATIDQLEQRIADLES